MTATRKSLLLTAAALLGLIVSTTSAKAEAFDPAMKRILSRYLKIQDVLAGDTVKDVPAHTKAILKIGARIEVKAMSTKNAKRYGSIPAQLVKAAKTLRKAKSIDDVRNAFKAMSVPMTTWALVAKPHGVDVMFCPMARSKWLQKHGPVRNPYYGASMLACGSVVSSGAHDHGTAHHHEKGHHHAH